jgi:hypothetical protein
MEIKRIRGYDLKIHPSIMGRDVYVATLRAVNKSVILNQMFHINLAPILGRWKLIFRKDLLSIES